MVPFSVARFGLRACARRHSPWTAAGEQALLMRACAVSCASVRYRLAL